jgi:membrane protease YdiL (CAAX protease family)
MELSARRQNRLVITGLILSIVFLFVLFIGIGFLHLSYVDRILYSRFIFWVECLLLILFATRVERQPFLLWDNSSANLLFFLVSVVVLYLLSWVCAIFSAIPRMLGVHENYAAFKRIALIFMHRPWLMFFTALTAGVTEELIFRAYILTRLAQVIRNKYLPVIISAFTFAALHYGYRNLGELIFVFLIGILFGAYYQKYRNIQVLIVVHFMIDIINLIISTHFYK